MCAVFPRNPLRHPSRGTGPCSADSPMLRVTVMILRDMVESVILLKDEDWKRQWL